MTDNVNKPKHYIGINGLEVEEVTQNFLPRYTDGYVSHRVGSAIEYLLRAPLKNGLEDIEKAKENLEQVILYEENKFKITKETLSKPTNDPLQDFLTALRNTKVVTDNSDAKIATFYHGYNPLD